MLEGWRVSKDNKGIQYIYQCKGEISGNIVERNISPTNAVQLDLGSPEIVLRVVPIWSPPVAGQRGKLTPMG